MGFVAEQAVLIGLLAAMVIAFFMLDSKKGGKAISYHEVTRLMNSQDGVLLDIGEASEFKNGHITGAKNIPFTEIATRLDELEKHKQKQLILADKMGQHANAAGKILKDKGYNVVRLQGGMAEWRAQNLPVVKK